MTPLLTPLALTLTTLLSLPLPSTAATLTRQNNTQYEYAGYLLSTFTDENPSIFWYLSPASDPLGFQPLNGGNPVLESTVGTRGVRDIFLTSNAERSEFYHVATDLDIHAERFSWDQATRTGSLGLVIWKSSDLVEWSEPWLATVESPEGGMAWAPSVLYNSTRQLYDVFWASGLYAEDDSSHMGNSSLHRIRHARTSDFTTFSSPEDYVALDEENIPLIDQEFLPLGPEGHWVRFLKDENVLHVYQETTSNGIFGSWERSPSLGDSGYIATRTFEGPAAFPDIKDPERYYLLMDDYTEYVAFVTEDVQGGVWEELDVESSGLPRGLKHGNVFLVTQGEYDALVDRYGL